MWEKLNYQDKVVFAQFLFDATACMLGCAVYDVQVDKSKDKKDPQSAIEPPILAIGPTQNIHTSLRRSFNKTKEDIVNIFYKLFSKN